MLGARIRFGIARRPIGSARVLPPYTGHSAAVTTLGTTASLLAYLALSRLVRVPQPVYGELELARLVQRVTWKPFAALMWAVSALGFPPALPAIPVLASLWLWRRGYSLEAVGAIISASAGVIATILKLVAGRPRPPSTLIRVSSPMADYGFPSGHTATYTGFCGFLTYLGLAHGRNWVQRRLFPLVCLGVVGLMGPSRVYRGHHWVSDVVAGYVLGGGHLLLVLEAYRRLRWLQGR